MFLFGYLSVMSALQSFIFPVVCITWAAGMEMRNPSLSRWQVWNWTERWSAVVWCQLYHTAEV